MAKCNYVAPQAFIYALSENYVVRTSGEEAKAYGNEGAWNGKWTPLGGEEEEK